MSATLFPFSQAVAAQQGVERFDIQDGLPPARRPSGGDPRPVNEDEINGAVQAVFQSLAGEVERRVPGVRSGPGRCGANAALHWWLSFRAFHPAGSAEDEAVIVGVNFEYRGDEVVVTGDISGDETGHLFYEGSAALRVPNNHAAVRAAGLTLAGELARQSDVLAAALKGK